MTTKSDDAAEAEAAQEAIQIGIERARELLCEAKQVIGHGELDSAAFIAQQGPPSRPLQDPSG